MDVLGRRVCDTRASLRMVQLVRDRSGTRDCGRHHQFCHAPPGHAPGGCRPGNAVCFRNLETGAFDGGVGTPMSFNNGILNLANWAGNVILPTLAGLFFAIAILRFARSECYSCPMYGGLLCLMASGLLRAMA